MLTTPRDFKYLFFLSPQQFVESVTAAVACEIKPEMIKNTAMHMIDGILPFNLSLPKLCICKHNFLRNTNTCRFIFLLLWAFPLYFLKYSSNLSSKHTHTYFLNLSHFFTKIQGRSRNRRRSCSTTWKNFILAYLGRRKKY